MSRAKNISSYLTVGMHHSTSEGQSAITEIITTNDDSELIDWIQASPNPRLGQVTRAWIECVGGMTLRDTIRALRLKSL